MKKIIAYIFLCFVIYSCQNSVYRDKLHLILGIDKVDVENSVQIDEFGVFGEGYTLEIYSLSNQTIKSFIENPNKILIDDKKNNYLKKDGWVSTSTDSIPENIQEIIFTLHYKQEQINQKIEEIKALLKEKTTYYAYYYYSDSHVQFYVLNIPTRKLYIIDTVI